MNEKRRSSYCWPSELRIRGCTDRAGAAAAGLLAVGVAFWFASSWIDMGDATCGSLWRTDIWRNYCDETMYPRLLVTLSLAILGVYLVAAAVFATSRGRVVVLATIGVAGTTAVFIQNEFARSGGLFA